MAPDILRPELHMTAEEGILNAPAGILQDNGTWHMFYQYQPTIDSPSRWGHSISSDAPFDWVDCDDALIPAGGEITLRAGSVVAEGEEGVELYFTKVTATGTTIGLAKAHELLDTCEVSDDTDEVDPIFIRLGKAVEDHGGYVGFRSPSVVPDWEVEEDRDAGHSGWLMLAVSGPVDSPTPVILTSPEGRDWAVVGSLTFEGDPGLQSLASIVSPRIMRLRDEVDNDIYDVLLVTVERDGIDHSGYLVGQLKGAVFHVTRGFTRIDYGHDFTRPRNAAFTPGTIKEDERDEQAVIFGLLNGIGRQDDAAQHKSLEEEGWANPLSLPRVVTLQDGLLYQRPPAGLPSAVASSSRARSWTGLCEIPDGSSLIVELYDANGEIAVTITHSGETLTLDRSMNQNHSDSQPVNAPLREDDSDSLTVIVDGSTVEVFADGGQIAMASRVHFDGGCSGMITETTGDAEIERSWNRKGLN